MWELGRWIPAEGLALDAVELSREYGDVQAQANAHRFLGNFYKSRLYIEHGWDASHHPDYDRPAEMSVEHFQKAEQLWREQGDFWGVATEYFNIATAKSVLGESDEACSYYQKAIERYTDESTVFTGVVHPWNRQFEDFHSMVEAFARNEGCAFAGKN